MLIFVRQNGVSDVARSRVRVHAKLMQSRLRLVNALYCRKQTYTLMFTFYNEMHVC